MTKRPELLSPAGDMERLDMALRYGADAVYLAGTQFGMRGGVKNFTPDELAEAVRRCHGQNVRVHVTVNTLPRTDELAALPDYLRLLESIGVDALIIADMGVLRLAKRYAPTPEKHISTQAGIVNAESALGWMELGASRVVLARELSLDEIRAIRRAVPPELELETFIHGSMCVSFSGRCLLSNYMTGRDAQRGVCAQPCRWKYALMEQTRPGEYFPVYEEDGGTYIMNSRDMCMIEHIPELIEAGIDSFKIDIDEDMNFDLHDISYTSKSYSAAIALRQYFGIARQGRFGVFNEVDLLIGSGSSDFTRPYDGQPKTTHTDISKLELNFMPGVSVFIIKSVAFNLSFGVFGFHMKSEKQAVDGEPLGERFTSGANFRFNIFNLNFGIEAHF